MASATLAPAIGQVRAASPADLIATRPARHHHRASPIVLIALSQSRAFIHRPSSRLPRRHRPGGADRRAHQIPAARPRGWPGRRCALRQRGPDGGAGGALDRVHRCGGSRWPPRGPGAARSGLLAEDALIVAIGQVRDAVARRPRRAGASRCSLGGDCPVILGRWPRCRPGRPSRAAVRGRARGRLATTQRRRPARRPDCELGLALRLFDGDPRPWAARRPAPDPRRERHRRRPARRRRGSPPGVPTAGGPAAGADPPGRAQLRRRRGRRSRPARASGGCTPTSMCSPPPSSPRSNYPQPGGLTWPQLGELTSAALATAGLRGLVRVHLQPDLTPAGRCRRHHQLPQPGDHGGGCSRRRSRGRAGTGRGPGLGQASSANGPGGGCGPRPGPGRDTSAAGQLRAPPRQPRARRRRRQAGAAARTGGRSWQRPRQRWRRR